MTNGELLLLICLKYSIPILVLHAVIRLEHKIKDDLPIFAWLEYVFIVISIMLLLVSIIGLLVSLTSLSQSNVSDVIFSCSLLIVSILMLVSAIKADRNK